MQADSVVQIVYEVFTGEAKLEWLNEDKVLSVTPVDATTKLPLPDLQEFYKFDTLALCTITADSGDKPTNYVWLNFASLEAKISDAKQTGFVAITADLHGAEKCKQIVWDPTNGELLPQSVLASASSSSRTTTGAATTTREPNKATSAALSTKPYLAVSFALLLCAFFMSLSQHMPAS